MKTRMTLSGLVVSLVVLFAARWATSGPPQPGEGLIVHEWGTFTSLQDDDGSAIGGLNIDDEPLPGFVHFIRHDVLSSPIGIDSPFGKGIPARHPAVTMRLETPVLYFYPPSGQQSPLELDVHVDFLGGWLTEFYPHAEAKAPGLNAPLSSETAENAIDPSASDDAGQSAAGSTAVGSTPPTKHFAKVQLDELDAPPPLREHEIGSLDWRGIAVGTDTAGPETKEHVWLAPRQVQAASVTAPPYVNDRQESKPAESEKYLFYRGVGHLDAPLHVVSPPGEDSIELRANFASLAPELRPMSVGPLWLVEARPDQTAAFRQLPELAVADDTDQVLATARRNFAEREFSTNGIDQLCDAMHVALVRSGLYDDEAAAMLDTWRLSYFRSPGLRLFFVVPRSWTDHYLPLTISQPATIERVMMGRIELISAKERQLLAQLRNTSDIDPQAVKTGRKSLRGTPAFQAYMDLGRFRRPLLHTEMRQRPSKNLSAFVKAYYISE